MRRAKFFDAPFRGARLFGATIVFALSACGPLYDTQYHFTPPTTGDGRACVFQCDNGKLQCRQLEDYRNEDCQRHADWEERDCEANIWREKGREPKWYECGSSNCSPDYDRCEQSYRQCYSTCGGRVEQERVCVANCEGAATQPPNSQPRAAPSNRDRPPASDDSEIHDAITNPRQSITPSTY